MANAKKCDRCGAYYDKNFAKTNSGSSICGAAFTNPMNSYLRCEMDLCDECLDKLKRFFAGVELAD